MLSNLKTVEEINHTETKYDEQIYRLHTMYTCYKY